MALTDAHDRPSVGEVLAGLSLALGVPIVDLPYDGPKPRRPGSSAPLREMRPLVVYVLRKVHGYTAAEVAAAMGCAQKTVSEASCRVERRVIEATNQRKD